MSTPALLAAKRESSLLASVPTRLLINGAQAYSAARTGRIVHFPRNTCPDAPMGVKLGRPLVCYCGRAVSRLVVWRTETAMCTGPGPVDNPQGTQ